MRAVTPRVYLIAQTRMNDADTRQWLDDVGGKNYFPKPDATDAENLVMMAGKRCYQAWEPGVNPNVTKVRDDTAKYIQNLLASRHGSVLSHIHFTFAIENVSRVLTAELNRHRVGVHRDELPDEPDVSEGSMRYIRLDDIPYVMPPCLRDHPGDEQSVRDLKRQSRFIFEESFAHDEKMYGRLSAIWADKLRDDSPFTHKKAVTSMLRRVVGIGVATGGTWTYSLRALRNVFTQRCAPDAEEEILEVGVMMLKKMKEAEPIFFADFEKQPDGSYKPAHFKV